MTRKLLILLSLILLIIPSAYAVGISGAFKPSYTFEPGLEINLTYSIVNSAGYGNNISIALETDSNYCCPDTAAFGMELIQNFSKLSFKSAYFELGESKSVNVYMKLPENIDIPGQYGFLIKATESGPGGTGIGAVAVVRTPFFLFVRYPGKHAQFGLRASDVAVGDTQTFYVRGVSRGTYDISNVYSVITVTDVQNNTITTLNTNSAPLSVDSTIELEAKWNTTGQSEGIYKATADIYYDGLTSHASSDFRIGSIALNILNYTTEVLSGVINPFEVKIESRWNDVIRDTYAIITVKNGSEVVAGLQTPTIEIPAYGTKTLNGFLVANIPPSNYSMDVILYFSGKYTSVQDRLNVIERKELIKRTILSPFTIFIILLLLNLVLWLIFIWRRRPKNTKAAETTIGGN